VTTADRADYKTYKLTISLTKQFDYVPESKTPNVSPTGVYTILASIVNFK